MDEQAFDALFQLGARVAKGFTGLSKTEVMWCQSKANWTWLWNVLGSESCSEMVLQSVLSPVHDFTMTFQLVIACLMDLTAVGLSPRVGTLCELADSCSELDHVFKNTKLLRLLLALHRNYDCKRPWLGLQLYRNANILLAHIVAKFPDLLKMNFFKANSKSRKLRFTQRDVDFWLKQS